MPHPDRPSRAGLPSPGWAASRSSRHWPPTSTSSRSVSPRPAPADVGGAAALAWNAALFTAFALHHSLMARAAAKAWLTRLVPAAY